ncbi:MAG: hypothetical protein OCD02_10295 [Spirochaetaceae bacterium]
MYTEYQNKEIKKMNMILNFTWIGSFIVNFFYFNIVSNRTDINSQFNIEIFKEDIVIIYLIIILISLFISLTLYKRLFSDKHFIDSKFSKLLQSYQQNSDRIVTNSETKIKVDLTVIYTSYTICLGLIHSASLYGLVSSINLETPYPFYLFILISLTGTVLLKPKLKNLIELVG